MYQTEHHRGMATVIVIVKFKSEDNLSDHWSIMYPSRLLRWEEKILKKYGHINSFSMTALRKWWKSANKYFPGLRSLTLESSTSITPSRWNIKIKTIFFLITIIKIFANFSVLLNFSFFSLFHNFFQSRKTIQRCSLNVVNLKLLYIRNKEQYLLILYNLLHFSNEYFRGSQPGGPFSFKVKFAISQVVTRFTFKLIEQ